MTNHETVACRTTQHCAFHGWCRRCDPAFAAVMSRVNVAIQRTDADESHWGPLYAAVAEALRPAAVSVPPPAPRADAVTAVRALHQPMHRGPFTICAHCSGWDGKWRCLGVVTDYPCPTIRALDGEQQPVGPCVAGEQQNETPEAATVHAVPLPGSNGISSCCGRPPCEFVGERVTRDPAKVTCSGPAAGVRQDGAQPQEVVHACPPDGSGLTPCCGHTPFELPRTDRISSEPAAVTCAPAAVAQPGKEKESDRG